MKKKSTITRLTATEIQKLIRQGKVYSDWAKADAMSEEALEAAIASDPDEAGMVVDWSSATIELPKPKAVLNMRVDRDVLEFFRKQGRGYQTTINAVLKSFVESQQLRR